MLKKEKTAMILFSKLFGNPRLMRLKEGLSRETRNVMKVRESVSPRLKRRGFLAYLM